ncbi:MAG: ATP-dependent metallopeptidase FtsH/Yme1/Tma family protein, partial [Polyangiaceae bacterium]
MKQSHKTLLLWVLLILMFLAIWQFLSPADKKQTIAFSEFLNEVHAGHVDEIHIKDREYVFRVHTADASKATQQKETVGPVADEAMRAALRPDDKNLPAPKIFWEKEENSPFWSSTLITLLPMLFIGVMFFLFMRQLQAGGGKAMSFGKAKARMLSDSANKVTFADVAGVDEAKDEV